MTNNKAQNTRFDLEDRTLKFSKECISVLRQLVRDSVNQELIEQLTRSSCSIGANYREANDSLTKKDFFHRVGIARREAKESKYWLELISHTNPHVIDKVDPLIKEALELTRILSSIVIQATQGQKS